MYTIKTTLRVLKNKTNLTKTTPSGDEEKEEDRISMLPDELIHKILSFVDAKDGVQTCVLSKRWIDIWKSLPFLKFCRSSFSDIKKFIEFVYMVFIFRGDTNIKFFRVEWANSFATDNVVTMNVNRWITHAVKYNVQKINIRITEYRDESYEFPNHLLNCKTLKKLVVQVFGKLYVDIVLPRSMNLPRLKVLELDGLSIPDVESSKRLLSSCPVLEKLSIWDCDIRSNNHSNKWIVDSPSLKTFEYYDDWRNGTMANIVKLCAPNLEEFLWRSWFTQDYSLENCSPLSTVTFDMNINAAEEDENAKLYEILPVKKKHMYAKRMMQFLGAVHMVKSIRLSPGFLEVLSEAPDILDYQPPLLYNLQSVVLEMWSTRGCLRAIAYLLNISPHVTEIYFESKEIQPINLGDVGDDWESGLSSPEMLSSLQYVEIEDAGGSDAEFKMLRFLMKNAKDLEEVVIFFRSSGSSPYRVSQVERFKKKLIAIPTASSSIELVFHSEEMKK